MTAAKTAAERKAAERQRHKDAGRTAVTVHVRPEYVPEVRALEALGRMYTPRQPKAEDFDLARAAIIALRAALAQQEQEPVAYTGDVARKMREAGMTFHLGMPHAAVMEQMTRFHDLVCAEASIKAAAAFATPPRREWQSLTEEEIKHFAWNGFLMGEGLWNEDTEEDLLAFTRAIEQALKERNA